MKYGCFSLDYRRFPLERAFRDARRLGFEGVEIWGGRPHAYPFDMDRNEIQKILNMQKTYGLQVPMYTPNALGMPYCLCSLDPREQWDALVYFKAAIDACAGIQSPRMLLVADHPGYTVSREDSWCRFVENMQQLAQYAAPKGVTLVIESLTPMESPVITTSDDCARALSDIGMENVEAMLDIVPPNIAYEPMGSYFEKMPGKVHYVHICNNDGRTDAHTRLDSGTMPVLDILHELKAYDFDGYVTVELYSECYKDPAVMLANAARVLNIPQPGE